MRVYFSASQRGKKKFGEYYQAIAKLINDNPHYKLLKDDLFSDDTPEAFYKKLNAGGSTAYIKLVERNLKNIKDADVNIFDSSVSSLSIGFMIQKSLSINKPTIVLYLEDLQPYFIEGIESEHLIIKGYTKDSLKLKLNEAIEEAKTKSDKRFNFFISPQLLDYLESISNAKRVSKSTFIRTLIEEHRRKNTR